MRIQTIVSKIMFVSLVLVSTATLSAGVEHQTSITLPIDKFYVVKGYDNNDFVRIVVKGTISNSCQKVAKGIATIDQTTKEINVELIGSVVDRQVCAQMQWSFEEIVDIGYLDVGVYQVHPVQPKLQTSLVNHSELVVLQAKKESIDDQDYAPVSEIEVNEEGKIVINGVYPYLLRGCMRVREVQVDQQADDIVVVKPVVRYLDGEDCYQDNPSITNRFQIETDISVKEGLYMHVRRFAGTSLDHVYLNYPAN